MVGESYNSDPYPHASPLTAEKKGKVRRSFVLFLKMDLGDDLPELCFYVEIASIPSCVQLGKDLQGFLMAIFGDEPARRLWQEIHSNMKCNSSLEKLVE